MPRSEYFNPLSNALVASIEVVVGLETESDEVSFSIEDEAGPGPVDAI